MYCLLFARCVAAGLYPLFHEHIFQVLAVWNPVFTNNRPSVSLFLFLGTVKCWCGTIAPCSVKLFDETVKTFAFFSSYMYLLDGDDNCMLSVPCSTSDFTLVLGKVAKNCQAVAAGAFTLLGYALWFSSKRGSSLFFNCLVVLPTRCWLDVPVL